MSREIKEHLFNNTNEPDPSSQWVKLSTKDWKEVLSRIDQIQSQVESCSEKIHVMYSRLVDWLSRIKEKVDHVSKAHQKLESSTQQILNQWEQKIMHILQPQQKREDQRRMADLMHRHSQFMQSYDGQLDLLKKSISRNEYHITQMLEEMKSLQFEMNFVKNKSPSKQSSEKISSPPSSDANSLYL